MVTEKRPNHDEVRIYMRLLAHRLTLASPPGKRKSTTYFWKLSLHQRREYFLQAESKGVDACVVFLDTAPWFTVAKKIRF